MSEVASRGTQAHAPDLDWSQVRETVLMLELAAGQIEAAMKDSNASVEVLTDSFTTMAGQLRMIADTVGAPSGAAIAEETRAALRGGTENVAGLVHQAIVAFQFYDKLVQRLAHVTHSLAALSELVASPGRLYNPTEWRGLQERIRAKYTMREEQAMFAAVMNGIPVKQALDTFISEMKERSDDIELF